MRGLNDMSLSCAPLRNSIIIKRCVSGIMSQAEHARCWEQHPNGGDVLPTFLQCVSFTRGSLEPYKRPLSLCLSQSAPWSASALPRELGKTHPRAAGFILGWGSGFRGSWTWQACMVLQTMFCTQSLEDGGLSQGRSSGGLGYGIDSNATMCCSALCLFLFLVGKKIKSKIKKSLDIV